MCICMKFPYMYIFQWNFFNNKFYQFLLFYIFFTINYFECILFSVRKINWYEIIMQVVTRKINLSLCNSPKVKCCVFVADHRISDDSKLRENPSCLCWKLEETLLSFLFGGCKPSCLFHGYLKARKNDNASPAADQARQDIHLSNH